MVAGAGGCSGDTVTSGAGFSAGNGEYTFFDVGAVNGVTLVNQQHKGTAIGGSYYESYANSNLALNSQSNLYDYTYNMSSYSSGGIGGGAPISAGTQSGNLSPEIASIEKPVTSQCAMQSPKWNGSKIVDSAQGGKGGNITISENAKIYAYNGSYITTKDSSEMTDLERQTTQALIYAQAGYDVKAIRELQKVKVVNSRTISGLVNEWSQTDYNFSEQRTIKSPYDLTCGSLANTYVLGIGSGAGGSQEVDGNGTYTIDASLN